MTKRFILSIALVVVVSSICFAADVTAPATVSSDAELAALPLYARYMMQNKVDEDTARKMLTDLGLDPDLVPQTHAQKAGFDPNEVVEVALTTIWANNVDHQRILQVYQGHGRYIKGDRKYLFASGRRVIPHTDANGHGDASSVIGDGGFKGPKIIVDGIAVFSQATGFCIDRNGKIRKAWFNILVDARQEVKSDKEVSDKDLVQIINCHGAWNVRERFDESTASYMEMDWDEWRDQEMLYAAYLSEQGDPSFFQYYAAKPGETVDLVKIHQDGLANHKYRSYSACWGGSDGNGAEPKFPVKSAKKSKKGRR